MMDMIYIFLFLKFNNSPEFAKINCEYWTQCTELIYILRC